MAKSCINIGDSIGIQSFPESLYLRRALSALKSCIASSAAEAIRPAKPGMHQLKLHLIGLIEGCKNFFSFLVTAKVPTKQ